MKNLAILLFVLLATYAQAADKKVKSTIKTVTVFQRGAQVYRTASTSLKNGHQVIVFTNLSTDINTSSIQVNGKGSFTIMSVTHQINYLKEIKKNKRIERINDSIKLLTHQINYKNQFTKAYQDEINLLKANQSLKGKDGSLKVSEIQLAADFYRKRFRQIYVDWTKLNDEMKELRLEVRKLQSELQQLRKTNAPKGVGEILVEIDAKSAVNAKFNFDYIVNSAGWTPLYDIRSTSVEDPVQLHYRANIYQSTGVDWKDVKLSVSTGNPRQNGTIPIMKVWYLSYYNNNQQPSALGYVNAQPRMAQEDATMDVEVSNSIRLTGNGASNSANFTTVNQGQTNTTFEISLPYTIPSSNKRVNVKVQKWELPATYRYYAAPRLDPDVFLQARITGWEGLSLLPGEVNIFSEGTYVGKSYLNPANLSDTLDISLGRDKSIIIERKKIKDKNSKAVLGSTKKLNVAWSISIRNNKSGAIHLVIQDQIPLSNRNDIEVSLGDKSDAKHTENTGFLVWDLKLDSKKTKKLEFNYQVKYPKDIRLSNVW